MDQKEKLEKVCDSFCRLNEEQQDYILGILQALAFAKSAYDKPDPENLPPEGLN